MKRETAPTLLPFEFEFDATKKNSQIFALMFVWANQKVHKCGIKTYAKNAESVV